MSLDLHDNWEDIRAHLNRSVGSSLHVAIGSVNPDNSPTVTPIGSLFLNKGQKGFYFEKFTSSLPSNGLEHKKICVLAVNSGLLFWLRSMFRGSFSSYPGLKLYASLGKRREATDIEKSRLRKRTKLFKISKKGYNFLWADMQMVRELEFYAAEKINLGSMTEKL